MALSMVDNHFGSTPPAAPPRSPLRLRSVPERSQLPPPHTTPALKREAHPGPVQLPTRFKAPTARQPALPGFTRGGSRGGSAARGSKEGLLQRLRRPLRQQACLRKALWLSVKLPNMFCYFSLYSASHFLLYSCIVKKKF